MLTTLGALDHDLDVGGIHIARAKTIQGDIQ